MIYSLVLRLLVAVYFCDSQRFQNGIIEGNIVWANNSGPALFIWRYTPISTDIPPYYIKCYYENNDYQIMVIRRKETNNTVVQTNDIQSTSLNGKVEGYVDSFDPTIFGFIITRTSRSDPKIYKCIATFNTYSLPSFELSPGLILQVLDPPELSHCLNEIHPVKYDSVLTVKCYAPGNPVPDLKCELWDENDVLLHSEGPFKENLTRDIIGEDLLLKLRKIVCYISAEKTGFYNKTVGEGQVLVLRPPFPPKHLTQIFPAGTLARSLHIQWAEIPVAEQGGELKGYVISYWVKGQPQDINKTNIEIGQPISTGGFIRYEIENLQTNLEYIVAVYGKNQYSTDVIDRRYYSSEIFAITSAKRESRIKGAGNGRLIGGATSGVVFILIILGLAVWFSKYKKTNIGNEAINTSDGNPKSYQKTPPIYAEVVDPNYIPMMPGSYTCKTYQELQSTHTNLETNDCSKNTPPVTIDITSKEYLQMRPYVLC